jgi:signal transduction histidine kinase
MRRMHTVTADPTKPLTGRTATLLRESQERIYQRTDRLFAIIMFLQWLAGIATALWLSPWTWIGNDSLIHAHVWAAVFLGAAISGLPIFLALKQPGRALNRHVIAVAQMLTSSLLIHLSGGRIETHFHIFGSLAFLAFYRDSRVLITATVIVTIDHVLRGMIWPQTIFGVLTPSNWRWIEHAGWVVFEDIFLFISIRQSLSEMSKVACQSQELAETSRLAGMAEVATSVLHNVGNVLNSVNIASSCLSENLRKSKAAHLSKVVALLQMHDKDLGAFFANDPTGKRLPAYLDRLDKRLASEQAKALKELAQLQMNIEHIKEIVTVQQSLAKASGLTEVVNVADLVEDALRINLNGLVRRGFGIVREFQPTPKITVQRHKVLQILVNLVRNAKHACDASPLRERKLTLRTVNGEGRILIQVCDNGIGIPRENLLRIFSHGFTTKKDGHGFGLHSGAIAASEMGGSLTVQSEGSGQGAVFTLELPCRTRENSCA